MAVFGALRRGRQAAKEHSAKQAEKQKQEQERPPYKHVPTHAAVDAMMGAPAGWRGDDRTRIIEAHRRRSTMSASVSAGHLMPMMVSMTPLHVGGSTTPRTTSSLSHVSFPYPNSNPVLHLSRSHSYGGGGGGVGAVYPTWNDRGEAVYSPQESAQAYVKGKGRVTTTDAATPSADSSRGIYDLLVPAGQSSLPAAHAAHSDDGSSPDSSGSTDELELRVGQTQERMRLVDGKPARPGAGAGAWAHHLHPSLSRRISDPYVPPYQYRVALSHARPAVAAGIPPVPALPEMEFEGDPVAAESSLGIPPVDTERPQDVDTAVTAPAAAVVQPVVSASPAESASNLTSERSADDLSEDSAAAHADAAPQPAQIPAVKNERRPSRSGHRHHTRRHSELGTIKSNTTHASEHATPSVLEIRPTKSRPSVKTTELPAEFDNEPRLTASPSPPESVAQEAVAGAPAPAAKSKRLSRTATKAKAKTEKANAKTEKADTEKAEKAPKKKRWSLRR